MLLVLNLPLIGLWVKLLTIPKPWLYAGILLFATLGTIGANPIDGFELGMLLAFGLLGYGLRRFGYPIAPVVVGLILGPMATRTAICAARLAIAGRTWTGAGPLKRKKPRPVSRLFASWGRLRTQGQSDGQNNRPLRSTARLARLGHRQ
jgi:hypothetical protein